MRVRFAPQGWLVLSLLLLALLYAWLYGVVGPRAVPSVPRRLMTYPLIFLLYGVAVGTVSRSRTSSGLARRPAPTTVHANGLLILLGAALLRVIVLAGAVPPNPDLGRHLWEGKVLLAGFNPYAAPPGDKVYDPLREQLAAQGDDLYSGLWTNYADVRSVYGPLATLLFAVPHLLPFDRYVTLRTMMTGFDFLTVLLLVGVARALGQPEERPQTTDHGTTGPRDHGTTGPLGERPQTTDHGTTGPPIRNPGSVVRWSVVSGLPKVVSGQWSVVVYAWSPVCLNGFADRGQVDAAMLFLVVLAVWLVLKRRPALAGVAFAGALLTKVSPLLLLLPLLRWGKGRMGAAFAVTLMAGLLPFASAGLDGIQGLIAFANRWRQNDSVYSLVLWALRPLGSLADTERLARVLVAAAALAYALLRSRRVHKDDPSGLVESLASISAAVILLSPVTFPWYTAPLLAFLCFRPRISLLVLSVVPMFWYLRFLEAPSGSLWQILAAAEERWRQPWRLPVYGLVAMLFLWEVVAVRRQRPQADAHR